MTKPKTVKKSTEAGGKSGKTAVKSPKTKSVTKVKDKASSAPVKDAAESKRAAADKDSGKARNTVVKAAKPTKAKPEPAAPASEAKSRPSAHAEPARAHEKSASSPAPDPKPALGFAKSGLGVKVASKKPALSVAPGVMISGRPLVAKPDAAARPMERKLSKKELTDIKTFLLERRERLLAGMRRELAMQRERAESKAADEVDKATDAYDEDLSFEIATANDQELGEIQVALEKIERGTYGECDVCGTNISPSRLKILPSATTCVSCRSMDEMARRRDESPNFNMITGEDTESEPNEM